MGNVLRVLGIVVASMLLGLVGLFLLLFTICGGLKSSDGSSVLAVCLVLIVGAVALIVFLGRGLSTARAAARGLAVAPAGAPMITPPSPYGSSPYGEPAVAAAQPGVPGRPSSQTDVQALVGLRIALIIYVLLSVGTTAFSAVSLSRINAGVATQVVLRAILGLVPVVAVLIAVSVRTPPAGAALDAAAGLGVASILFRFGMFGFMAFTPTFSAMPNLSFLLLRFGAYSALEALISGLALHLRSRIGGVSVAGLAVAIIAFLVWDGVIQAAMQMLVTLLY